MTVLRVVETYDAALRVGAVQRGDGLFLGEARCMSVRTIRAGGARGLTGIARIDDPDELLDDDLRAEVTPLLVFHMQPSDVVGP